MFQCRNIRRVKDKMGRREVGEGGGGTVGQKDLALGPEGSAHGLAIDIE